ncbi:unnamed protein product [Musa acuminata subsp. malaccensis]|uniref:(wild Malaysian banana) hypothetical protein n=1 Tax=Musa acuminata subsp. malaccensis TaxID=214687 RepID=A0A8D7F9P4_MUSAM|nr:unnamed protein product [Musa acuminata subsp. malaccensis]
MAACLRSKADHLRDPCAELDPWQKDLLKRSRDCPQGVRGIQLVFLNHYNGNTIKLTRKQNSISSVTNDIFTKEDGEFLVKHGALPEERIRAVETGHTSLPLEELSNLYKIDIPLCESGGHNLAANFSRELADYIIYIIDVSGGDKIPRKGGPGITQADLLVINKTDIAQAVGADLAIMERDALRMRDGGPFVFAQRTFFLLEYVKHAVGVEEIVNHVLQAWAAATGDHRH